MSDQLAWGILGTGWIATLQTSDLLEHGFKIAAVGSRTQESADKFAAEYGIPTAHGSYEDLVADPNVDAIYVATPHPFHEEHALLALNAGKHVLVEKAFTMNAAQAENVVSRAAELNLVVLEAMWTRYLPHMVRIRELVKSGALGTIRSVMADHNQNISMDPLHRLNNPLLGGGALLDLGIYPVSFTYDILGAPTSIVAVATKTVTNVDRQTSMIFSYGDEAQAVIQTTLDLRGPTRAVIVGSEGRIEIDETWYAPTTYTRFDGDGTIVEEFDGSVTGRGMQFQAAELERLVTAGEIANDILSPSESVEIMRTLDEVRRQIGLTYPMLDES
ncbi:Gfo/Idh/MocA family protein [Salinibacterium sp. NK8237]|uniref:Gfo/Idh/MocA family protein n=1 Tax=Salinibacterium sp. NK8237 TaxID=2792038 RepID=UPI0018CEC81B|nr:Gfo/Idh/MocA family oxidoreductase [Salinibacterium sp. NK8237]MBH0130637.1 Gfo/Idh/MocA family oxidoreductase [Salinibacterium sp. NK8237]